jgi:hypothetical protein
MVGWSVDSASRMCDFELPTDLKVGIEFRRASNPEISEDTTKHNVPIQIQILTLLRRRPPTSGRAYSRRTADQSSDGWRMDIPVPSPTTEMAHVRRIHC